ncbi:MAG: SEC-C domain-containing protein [Bryobacteraceae bacterium]
MATAAQITANQANAANSTGPRTANGKAASALNGLRHGFRSQSVLIPGDDPAEYQQLLDELTAHFSPAPGDLTAVRHIREMADAEWRLRRARVHHEWLLTESIEALAAAEPGLGPVQLQVRAHEQLSAASPYFRQILRFEEKFERQYNRALRSWSVYQQQTNNAQHRHFDRMFKAALLAPLPRTGAAEPESSTPPSPETENDTTEPNSVFATPRNAACPCGSGVKFKRCCGASAPPTLGRAA